MEITKTLLITSGVFLFLLFMNYSGSKKWVNKYKVDFFILFMASALLTTGLRYTNKLLTKEVPPHISEQLEPKQAKEKDMCLAIRSEIFYVENNDTEAAEVAMNAWKTQNRTATVLNVETITQVENRGMTTVIASLKLWYMPVCGSLATKLNKINEKRMSE